jgi:hypothetical protein
LTIDMLSFLRQQISLSFSRIVTGDELWFLSLYQSDHVFTKSWDEVIPRTKHTIGAQKVMLTIFYRYQACQLECTATWWEIRSTLFHQYNTIRYCSWKRANFA